MYQKSIHHLDDLLRRIAAHRRFLATLCTCGKVGQVYADDGVTALCAPCWLTIYQPTEREVTR